MSPNSSTMESNDSVGKNQPVIAEIKALPQDIAMTNEIESSLAKLETLCNELIQATATKLGVNNPTEVNGKLLPFGAYTLGCCFLPTRKIDALLLVPVCITYKSFFDLFLERSHANELITLCLDFPFAINRNFKLKFDGINIDLYVVRIDMPTVPNDFQLENYNKNWHRTRLWRASNYITSWSYSQPHFGKMLSIVKQWAIGECKMASFQ